MAKKQTRRTVSFNRDVYIAIMHAAADRGVSCAEYVTEVLREHGLDLPETRHEHVEHVQRATQSRKRTAHRKAQGFTAGAIRVPA